MPDTLSPALRAAVEVMARAIREDRTLQPERSATAALRALIEGGYSLHPPLNAEIPNPAPGQVWRSPNPRIEPRTVVSVGAEPAYRWAGNFCLRFTTPSRKGSERWGPPCITFETWKKWARKSGARPSPPTAEGSE